MAAYVLNIRRVQAGVTLGTGSVPKNAVSTAEVNSALTRSPNDISVCIDIATEAQLRGLLAYAQAANVGLDTSSIETAVALVI